MRMLQFDLHRHVDELRIVCPKMCGTAVTQVLSLGSELTRRSLSALIRSTVQ
jgi:hypothetical protein